MKRTVALVVLVAWLLNCAPKLPYIMYLQHERQYPIAISPRVGETIDAEERKQYDLFHTIEEFKEATFYVIRGGGYELEIVTETKRLASVNHDRDAVIILREYIDKYEEIKNDRTPWEAKWGIIDYDTLGVPITKHEVGRFVDRGHAIRWGLISGCVASLTFAAAIASIAYVISKDNGSNGVGRQPTPEGIGDVLGGIMLVLGASVAAGSTVGCITGAAVSRSDRNAVLKAIKEVRKPKIVE